MQMSGLDNLTPQPTRLYDPTFPCALTRFAIIPRKIVDQFYFREDPEQLVLT